MPGGEPKVENDSVCFSKTLPDSCSELNLSFFCVYQTSKVKSKKNKAFDAYPRITEKCSGIELGWVF